MRRRGQKKDGDQSLPKLSRNIEAGIDSGIGLYRTDLPGFCSCQARELLGQMPEHMLAECSGNIIKNVKGAIVPNSGGMKGVEAAIAIGAVGGNAQKELEVVADIQAYQIAEAATLVKAHAFVK